jgi:hypothetical protein
MSSFASGEILFHWGDLQYFPWRIWGRYLSPRKKGGWPHTKLEGIWHEREREREVRGGEREEEGEGDTRNEKQ